MRLETNRRCKKLIFALQIAQNVIVELQYKSQTLSSTALSSGNNAGFPRSAYLGWTGMSSRRRLAAVSGRDGYSRNGTIEQEVPTIEVDSTFGKLLGLSQGQKIGVYLHLDPPIAHTVNIEPLTPADWEIIELHATFLELNTLSQIRALPNPSFTSPTSTQAERAHPLTLHLSPTSTANVIVTSLTPPIPNTQPFAKISPDAEVIVAPKDRPHSNRGARTDTKSVASRRSGRSGVSSSRTKTQAKGSLFLRGVDQQVADRWFENDNEVATTSEFQVWLDKDILMNKALRGQSWVTISVVRPAGLRAQLEPHQVQALKDAESSEAGIPSSKVVARLSTWKSPPDAQHAALSTSLCAALGHKGLVGSIIKLEPAPLQIPRSSVQALKIFPFSSGSLKAGGIKFGGDSNAIRRAIGDEIQRLHGMDGGLLDGPVTEGMVLPSAGGLGESVTFKGGVVKFHPLVKEQDKSKSLSWFLGSEHKPRIEVQTEIPTPVDQSLLGPARGETLPEVEPDLVAIDPVIAKCMNNLTLCSSVLLEGGLGSGKTSLAQLLCLRLKQDYLFNAIYFPCRKLVTDETRISTIKETLTRLFMSASWSARLGGQAIVVLDDLDVLCPVETELQVGNDNGRSRQASEIISTIVREYCGFKSGIVLLATAQSKDNLNAVLVSGHVVTETISLKAPNKDARRQIFEKIAHADSTRRRHMNGAAPQTGSDDNTDDSWLDPEESSRPPSSDGFHLSTDLDFLDLAGKTDGYMPGDLLLLVSRARNEALIRAIETPSSSDTISLSKTDFTAALAGFTPASLRNVTLTHSTTTFSSIGGLHSTRRVLLETLQYPTKYAPIFASCPLRLRSGLLLYGFPGCGKTLLASAVAGECGLNFISVKGPEILNKYIGASEKSVRDLFDRAEAAKPCILFFDEFDSIAPKRGHDSTGVTDRVVNQLLTQMDGAEGLSGVYVLAATSRPDLIDPALLRPGRLDKSLLCDMPNHSDRLDILTALSEKLSLTPEATSQLPSVAEKTEGYSGADLQAVLYNAHLEAIHDLLGDITPTPQTTTTAESTTTRPPIRRKSTTSSRKQSTGKKDHHHSENFTQFAFSPSENPPLDPPAVIAEKLAALKALRKSSSASHHQPSPTTPTTPSLSKNTSNNNNNNTKDASSESEPKITPSHLQRSLASTKASISGNERRRLGGIYAEFVEGRRNGEGSYKNAGEEMGREVGGRSSLM